MEKLVRYPELEAKASKVNIAMMGLPGTDKTRDRSQKDNFP